MRKIIWTGTCSALIGIVSIAATAQTSSSPQSASATTPAKSVTVTGCLKEAPMAPPSAVGTTGAAGAAGATTAAGTTGTTGAAGATAVSADPSTQKFILANAIASSPDTAAAASSAATTAAAASSPSAATQTYRLIANPAPLVPLVGKKLELTGTLEDQSSSAASSDSASSDAKSPTLRVTSGKVVAASCSN